jgi:hypothetical protein
MTEHERRRALVAELGSDPAYATGRRRFPRTVSVEDAVWITGEGHERLDEAVEERARLARARGRVVACASGCSACCEQPVTVYRPEAELIAAWLRRPENAAAREAFLAAYPAWRERAGDAFAPIVAAIAAGDVAAEEQAHLAAFRGGNRCAFNRDDLCTIYPVRPAVCRHCHALETADRCRAESYLPSTMSFVPADRLLAVSRQVARAMHHALGGARATPMALCEAVHERLTS